MIIIGVDVSQESVENECRCSGGSRVASASSIVVFKHRRRKFFDAKTSTWPSQLKEWDASWAAALGLTEVHDSVGLFRYDRLKRVHRLCS
jgi:hypothetical protein